MSTQSDAVAGRLLLGSTLAELVESARAAARDGRRETAIALLRDVQVEAARLAEWARDA